MNPVTRRRLISLGVGLCVGAALWSPAVRAAPADTPADAQAAPADAQAAPAGGGGADKTGSITEIGLLTSATKADWLSDEIGAFNQKHSGQYRVVMTHPLESRDAMQKILSKQVQPVLWSPSSPVWLVRLGAIWQQKNNTPIVDMEHKSDYGVFLRSPIVFLTTQEKAKFLRQQLGGRDDAWQNIRLLSLGKKQTPWHTFTFAYSDPTVANSGMLALGLILNDYAQHAGHAGDMAHVANSAGFITYLQELHGGHFVYDAPAKKGSGPLADAFADNDSRYDFIATYESLALTEIGKNPDLAVVYPNPTVMSEQSIAVLEGDWVTDAQKQGAQAFLDFLASEPALESGVRYNFRPDRVSSNTSLAPELARHADHGFQDSVFSEDMPPYEAINDAIFQWQKHVAHQGAAP